MDIALEYVNGYCVKKKVNPLSVSPQPVIRTQRCKLLKSVFVFKVEFTIK